MTQPTPTPGPNTVAGQLAALGQQAAGNKNTPKTTGDLYGLGDWGGQTVNPGDLPFTPSVLGSGSGTTGDAIVKAFAGASPGQVATVQHALLMGGYYPANYNPRYGVISPDDIRAFAAAVKTAGQSGQAVTKILEDSAAYGAAAGVAAAQQAQSQQKGGVAQITLPNTQDLEAAAMKAFQSIVGHNPTPKQAAQFAALYRGMSAGMQRSANQAQYDAQNPPTPPTLQGVDPGTAVHNAMHPPVAAAPRPHVQGQYVNETLGDPTMQTPPPDATFTAQVGGLMSLGQAIQQAQTASAQQSAQPVGLTQLTADSPVSPDVAALNYARNQDPRGAAANDTANTFTSFLSLLSRNFG